MPEVALKDSLLATADRSLEASSRHLTDAAAPLRRPSLSIDVRV